jgi:hypothetical protein
MSDEADERSAQERAAEVRDEIRLNDSGCPAIDLL